MKYLFLSVLSFVCFNACVGQLISDSKNKFYKANPSDSIIYVFPDFVENEAYKFILRTQKTSNYQDPRFSGFLQFTSPDTFKLVLLNYGSKQLKSRQPMYKRIKTTNRFFIVDSVLYPLIFESDFIFGTLSPIDNLGKMGDRYDKVLRSNLIIEDFVFSLLFTREKLIR